MQAWPPGLTQSLLSNPAQLSTLCSALVRCFDFSPSAAALLLYANPQPGPYTSATSNRQLALGAKHASFQNAQNVQNAQFQVQSSAGQPGQSTTATQEPSVAALDERTTQDAGTNGLSASADEQALGHGSSASQQALQCRDSEHRNGMHDPPMEHSESPAARWQGHSGPYSAKYSSSSNTPASADSTDQHAVLPLLESLSATESNNPHSNVHIHDGKSSKIPADSLQKSLHSEATAGATGVGGVMESQQPMASVLLPRMPAGLELLSGSEGYEAVAGVARAMGRAANAESGL